ncbi:MAG: homocysteine S-methyltransferase family protein [Phycisphaerae bacterium]
MSFDPADYRKGITLAGGDFITELTDKIGHTSDPPEQANVEHPEQVRDIAEAFVQAGASILTTYTDGANAVALADLIETGDIDTLSIRAINREGAVLCREALAKNLETKRRVLGAMGPVEHLISLDEIDETVLFDAYRAQAVALAEGGADAILCRSFTEIEAMVVAVRAAIDGTGLPVIGSLIFDSGPEYNETAMGVSVPQACTALVDAGASMVGCDRSEYPDGTAAIVTLLRQSCDLPIWVEINAGRAEIHDDQVVYPSTPKEFAESLRPIAEAGAGVIGGGWGVTVAHIAEMARSRERYLSRESRRG